MQYISLLVHENFPVVLNTIENFLKHTDAVIVVHRSLDANFSREILEKYTRDNFKERVIVNEDSIKTYWGNVYDALLCNIKLILKLANKNDVISFHASNDMFIRDLKAEEINMRPNRFHQRIYKKPGHWSHSKHAFNDKNILNFIKKEGLNCIVGSQIEGSSYCYAGMKEIVRLIEKYRLTEGYPFAREEIIFSTPATLIQLKPDSNPYVFSELHRIDRKMFKIEEICDSIPLPRQTRELLVAYLQKKVWNDEKNKLNRDDIDSILRGEKKFKPVKDGRIIYYPYVSCNELCAVKRVPRLTEDPIRKYISTLK